MKPDLLISIVNLVVSILTSGFIGYITFLTLRFTAKPLVRFGIRSEHDGLMFNAEEVAKLWLHCENVGRWYAKPAATNLRLYLNFDPVLDPRSLKYGSQFERLEQHVHEVRRGKRNSKYMKAGGIQLFFGEPGEEVEIEVKMPSHSGRHLCWVAGYCDEGDCGIYEFVIESRAVVPPRSKNSKSGTP